MFNVSAIVMASPLVVLATKSQMREDCEVERGSFFAGAFGVATGCSVVFDLFAGLLSKESGSSLSVAMLKNFNRKYFSA